MIRELWTVKNADGSIRYQSPWYEDCTRDIMPCEVDNVVNINYAADDAFDAVEEDDHLVSYQYMPWTTILETDTRHESYRDCYAIANGIRAWIGRIEHICEIES